MMIHLEEKPKLLLHVGIPKTGTTSLQFSLADNSSKLLDLGVSYSPPESGKGRNIYNHSSFLHAILYEYYSVNNYNSVILGEYKERKGFKMSAKAMVEYVKKSFIENNCKTLVLSYEGFGLAFKYVLGSIGHVDNNDIKEYAMSYVKKHFSEFDVKIVIYLRRQDDYIESLYNQAHKKAPAKKVELIFENAYLTNTVMHDFITNKKLITFCDYYSQLCQWSNIYGKENIIVRVYEKGQMPSGTVYDFYKYVLCFDDSKIEKLLTGSRLENESVKKDLIEYKIALGKDSMFNLTKKEMFAIDKKDSLVFLNKIRSNILTAKQASNLLEYYKESNMKVAKEFLGREDGILFRDKPRDEVDDFKGLSHQATFHISKELLLLYKENNDRLNHRLEAKSKKNILLSKKIALLKESENIYSTLAKKERKLNDKLKANIQSLETGILALKIELKNIQNSTSWKITKPFRAIKRFLQKRH